MPVYRSPRVYHSRSRSYTELMPTTRPRHFVTESDELAQALDAEAARWPGLSRGQLVARLAIEAHQMRRDADEHEVRRRREIIAQAGTLLSGMNARAELARMREEDWPE